MAEEVNDFGTLESLLLKLVIESGHKPIAISVYDGDELFVFRSKEEAQIAKLDFSPEGIWIDADTLNTIKDDLEGELFEIPELMAMTEEERILKAAEIKAKKVSEAQKKILKMSLGVDIKLAKSCETCEFCRAYSSDPLRECSKTKAMVSGHSVCDDWEERKKRTKGGVLNYGKAARSRERQLGLKKLTALLEVVGEQIEVTHRGRTYVYEFRDGQVQYARRTGSDGSLSSFYTVGAHTMHDKVLLAKDLSKLF